MCHSRCPLISQSTYRRLCDRFRQAAPPGSERTRRSNCLNEGFLQDPARQSQSRGLCFEYFMVTVARSWSITAGHEQVSFPIQVEGCFFSRTGFTGRAGLLLPRLPIGTYVELLCCRPLVILTNLERRQRPYRRGNPRILVCCDFY